MVGPTLLLVERFSLPLIRFGQTRRHALPSRQVVFLLGDMFKSTASHLRKPICVPTTPRDVDSSASSALTDASLSRLADKLVHSFVYSNDIVSRLSLGSIRDLRNTAMWLCEANEAQEGKSTGEGYSAISERARKWKAGKGSPGDMEWVSSISRRNSELRLILQRHSSLRCARL
jgi:hypothetical protein